jgi:hypothetical protein
MWNGAVLQPQPMQGSDQPATRPARPCVQCEPFLIGWDVVRVRRSLYAADCCGAGIGLRELPTGTLAVGRLAQLARARPLQGRGHWFESSIAQYEKTSEKAYLTFSLKSNTPRRTMVSGTDSQADRSASALPRWCPRQHYEATLHGLLTPAAIGEFISHPTNSASGKASLSSLGYSQYLGRS